MSARVAVRPEMLHWAVDRSRRVPEDLAEGESAALPEWLSGTGSPTMRQLEAFARKARVPLGYLFLPEPPVERLPIRDFRTTTDGTVPAPSPDLLETVATMQRRQEWLRDHLIRQGEKPLPIVGAADIAAGVAPLVEAMHEQLNLPAGWNIDLPDADATLRTLREAAEAAGVLVSIGGYAGTDTRRTFDVGEFRGFVLVDQYAPLVFVNGADAKTAQLFTLAHELAHVWLGEGGVVNPAADSDRDPGVVESLCNRAAAAFLMPAALLRSAWAALEQAGDPLRAAARRFNVSVTAVARRAKEVGLISADRFFAFLNGDRGTPPPPRRRGGGNFYRNLPVQLGRRFSRAVVDAVRGGELTYREAYRLTDLKPATFERYAAELIGGRDAG